VTPRGFARAGRALAALTLVAAGLTVAPQVAEAAPCDPPVPSPIACENSKPGSPSSEWDIAGSGDDTVQGFATDMSVNKGETVRFKVKATSAYRVDIYRMGYYGGNGARKIHTVASVASQAQPDCLEDTVTGLVDCGNWAESTSWAVPSTAVSGIYVALLTRLTTGGTSHIVFVVRDDASTSAVLFQTSDSTWQAYNSYGDKPSNRRSLYPGPNGTAVKVSYNRPFTTRGDVPAGRDFVFANEYPMVRWLEANGYDVTYTTNVDSDRRGALIKQHKIFLSTGHDEYWSKGQRANVEAARDAGVNLAFFSGNSVYWKTRWEASTASGNSTPYRTLVTYKETRANAKTDPSPEWTGTWRDPRFSPPADGGRPENQLMGTAYKVNTGEFSIKVPEADGKMRLWRNTSVATLAPGTTATLEANTLGYEWDEDLDNGFRPAGLIRMSTTTENVQEYLIDYGSTVVPGVATHHLTLYRAPSGALVFGGGTIQWSWGLDGDHDGTPSTPDVRMRQATVNLFADMGVQPATLQAGLVAATKSTDTTAPTAVIASPAPGSSVPSGENVTVTGTATDSGGGRVGGIEVSTDGGATWHPATGRSTWTYTGPISGAGSGTIKARATDDSGNIQGAPASVAVNVSCPCRIFTGAAAPATPDSGDNGAIEVGMKFRSDRDAVVSGVRFYKSSANTGTHVGNLWSSTGTKLATATFTGETGSGWQQVSFATPVNITAHTTYIVSYYAPNGRYSADNGYFAGTGVDSPPLHALKAGTDGPNGVYRYQSGGGFPNQTFGSANYWVDVVVSSFGPPDTTPPSVTGQLPQQGATSVATSAKAQATFGEPVQPATVAMTLKNAANMNVAGATAYDVGTRTATFTPASPLALGTTYTATVSGATDLSGNAMGAPVSWTFTTAASAPAPGSCPCSIWSDAAVPATQSSTDETPTEVGVKFRASVDGTIEGLRFFKGAGNEGPHTGRLWSSTGAVLGTANFNAETPTGWQQASFATPVAVTAGTTYVASYYAQNGRYAATSGYFSSAATVSGPLTALANGTDGPNGVYLYGSNGFPTQSFGASNYWVDVVFTVPQDLTPPTATIRPGAGATSVPVTSTVRAVFGEPVQAATVSLVVKDAANATVAGSTAYDASTRTATFTPAAALAAGAAYSATLSGATDNAGNTMATVNWNFTTAGIGACPCSLFETTSVPGTTAAGDTSAVEVGVKFRADVNGNVTGVRFYKGPGNTGTHVGNLWSATGANLATATFTGETASGWQQVNFATPVPVTAGTTYVASYHAPAGRYAADGGFFNTATVNSPLTGLANGTDGPNGVYLYGPGGFPTQSFGATNYWVDVVFTPPPADTTAPTVTSTSPAGGATSVGVSTTVKATFSEAVQPATVTFTLKDAANATVAGSVAYDAATRTATFTPAAALAAATTYTATVSGAKDTAGNAMAAPVSWSFTTTGTGACPCTIFSSSTVPGTPASTDTSAVEVGVKFRSDTNGFITGVRFYKGTGNTGTHVGNLWSATGANLATATFTAETGTGWQQVNFATPVAVTAGITYVASYHAPNGRYAADSGFFNTATVNSPLTGLANGTDGPNGLYLYGPGGFPTQSFGAANYWVDVSFTTVPPADTTAPTVDSTSPAGGASSVPTSSAVSATFSEDVQPATIALSVRDAANAAVAGTTSYTSATRTVTFTPAAPLAAGATYTATVSGAKDAAGNTMATPFSWSFATAAAAPAPGTCPCTIWTDATAPATPASSDTGAIEVGVKFRSDTNGFITGVRFYKGTGNTGTHVGNLWSAAGANLATATFTGETATGWQQVSFATPVAVTAGTTYVASYHAPSGRYAVDSGYFASTGVTRGPLTALANGIDGPNAVYGYGAGGFPTSSFGSANYWVDVVFSLTSPDTAPPTVTGTAPAAGATGVASTVKPQATFSESVQAATVNFTVRDGANVAVAGSVAYDDATRTATFTPMAALAASTTYTASVSGAKDAAGNTMATSVTWSFTTAAPPDTTAPTVTARTPAPGASGVARSTTVSVTFSEQVQPATVSFVLRDSSNKAVAGTLTYDSVTFRSTFTPRAPLNLLATYTARVTGAKDAAGNTLAGPVSWSFTTGLT
jgi:methionine-rich copper-binding protein CopC